ncbi:beta-trefoil DNA-binding domain-containing protein [Phycomyces nitens]|nr:beta-trefoil DNA-binding domain-containing protein [Phycomyces nitens]
MFEPIRCTAELTQSPSSFKPLLQQYLVSRNQGTIPANERTVMILTSKVAQKSYGTEKRFLCPPPTTLLTGADWWSHEQASRATPAKLTIQISGEATSQTGVLEWHNQQGALLDSAASMAATACVLGETQIISGKCVSKQLHINDADEKRKRVEVLVKIQLGNGLFLGTLASKGIKVISKPSKKRQSAKNMDLCIHHGTTISLFNRIRSQTVSTKYLGVRNQSTNPLMDTNGTCFIARTGQWDPFVVWIVDTQQSENHPHTRNKHIPPPPAIALKAKGGPVAIHYNQSVVLQCATTGLVSPVMVIRKVDRGSMALGGSRIDRSNGSAGGECGDEVLGDPVSQLHKIAFQIIQDPSAYSTNNTKPSFSTSSWDLPDSCQPVSYLACLNDVVGMHRTTASRILHKPDAPKRPVEPSRRNSATAQDLSSDGSCWTEDVSDAAVWTIVGTDCASYTFWTPDISRTQSGLTQFPTVNNLTTCGDLLTLTGEHIGRDLKVWFGDIEAKTDYQSKESIRCVVPDTHILETSLAISPADQETSESSGHTKSLPLLLVRTDGLVYQTDLFYTF